jgi:hypothetical protein
VPDLVPAHNLGIKYVYKSKQKILVVTLLRIVFDPSSRCFVLISFHKKNINYQFMRQLTYSTDEKFCLQLAQHINKSHPFCAEVIKLLNGYAVVITDYYYNACKQYVQKHCKIKAE